MEKNERDKCLEHYSQSNPKHLYFTKSEILFLLDRADKCDELEAKCKVYEELFNEINTSDLTPIHPAISYKDVQIDLDVLSEIAKIKEALEKAKGKE